MEKYKTKSNNRESDNKTAVKIVSMDIKQVDIYTGIYRVLNTQDNT